MPVNLVFNYDAVQNRFIPAPISDLITYTRNRSLYNIKVYILDDKLQVFKEYDCNNAIRHMNMLSLVSTKCEYRLQYNGNLYIRTIT